MAVRCDFCGIDKIDFIAYLCILNQTHRKKR